jgi:hypothetical protein
VNGFSPAQAIISAMITPALLILASGSLVATALVRLARVVDRVRALAKQPDDAAVVGELMMHERRALLAERAMRFYFAAVVCFVVAGFAIAADHFSGDRLAWIPVSVTALGMGLILAGCAAMLAECQLSAAQIRAEIDMLRRTGA